MKRIFLLLILISCLIKIIAQDIKPPVNIQSPNATNLGHYGDVPISYFTGTPDVGVPIHNLNINGIDLNITLNYDATGIIINQHPGWVGQNWSISAGGIVTRTVQGQADELDFTNTGLSSPYPKQGYLFHYNELTDSNTDDLASLKNIAYNAGGPKYYDYEPDIFTFNFMGFSGKFFLDNDGNWKVISKDNLLVIFENYNITPLFEYLPGNESSLGPKYPKVIGGFKIIDSDGNIYMFGYEANSIEYSIGFYNQVYIPQGWVANAWYMTKVIDRFGNEVYNFEYERGSFIAQFYRGDVNKAFDLDGNGGLFNPAPSCASSGSIVGESYSINGSLISPVYLRKIYTLGSSNYTIAFESTNSTELKYDANLLFPRYQQLANLYTGGVISELPIYYLQSDNQYIDPAVNYLENLHWRKLDRIIILNLNNSSNKRIEFNYNNNINERLNLSSLDVYDIAWPYVSGAKKIYSYSFLYNQFSSLPGYLSKKNDHWGFYDGTAYTIDYNNFSTYYNQRQSSSTNLMFGLLTKITYPTGGYTQFEYERHDYSQISQDDRSGMLYETGIAGGVRIKSITNNDGTNNIVRNFKYVTGYTNNHLSTTSSGVLAYKPKYYWADWRIVDQDFGEYSQSVFSVNNLIPLANSFGSHIGYSEVVEVLNDGSYTIYKFSNFNSGSIYEDNLPLANFYTMYSPFSKYTDKSVMRGKLLEKSAYNSSNAPVKKTTYTYRTDQSMYNHYILASNAGYLNICPNSAVSLYTGGAYKIYYYDYDEIKETTTDYRSNGNVTEEINLTREDIQINSTSGVGNIRLLKKIDKTSSIGNLIDELYYPCDLLLEANMKSLNNQFRIGMPVKTISTHKIGSITTNIGANKTTYKLYNGLIVKDKEYWSLTNESNLLEILSYEAYNLSGRIVQTKAKDGITRSYLWGYKGQCLVAELIGGTYSVASSIINQSVLNNPSSDSYLRTELNKLRTSPALFNTLITTYTHNPLVGITSITSKNGLTTYYQYDTFNRIESIKDDDNQMLKKYTYNYSNN